MGGKVIVVTGSTKGIGKGLAREFLKRGHHVVVSGRKQADVDAAVSELSAQATGGARTLGVPCDVTNYDQTQALWDRAVAALGKVDIWINNAGTSNSRFAIGALEQDDVEAVPRTNIAGTMNGAHVALKGMTAQGSGFIYNFEGFGSNGSTQKGMSLYGASKNAVTYFTKAMISETKKSPVRVGYLSPGIVITDLSVRDKTKVSPREWAFTVMIYNILADRVETVTPWLAEKVLANDKHGAKIAWLTPRMSLWRFLKSRFVKPGDRFPELRLSDAA